MFVLNLEYVQFTIVKNKIVIYKLILLFYIIRVYINTMLFVILYVYHKVQVIFV